MIYPAHDAPGATDLGQVIQGRSPGAVVTHFSNGLVHVLLRPGPGCEAARVDDEPPPPDSIHNPLLIVDGVPVTPREAAWELGHLDPAEVLRIVVVRDIASTAMYGTRGECGVIFLTTKR